MITNRPVDFGYEQCWLSCPNCTNRTPMSFPEYSAGATVRCGNCGADVSALDPLDHAVAAVNDPALHADSIAGLSWFHTSTHEKWPPLGEAPTDPAVHLGTYEAAIENMLRRITGQDDSNAQFYLHRVRLAVNPGDIAEQVRQEFSDWVGNVPQSVVRADGHRVLRYVNRHEHKGCISLAVVPSVIAAVQTIDIPLPLLSLPSAAALQATSEYVRLCEQIEASRPDMTGIGQLDLLFPNRSKDPRITAIAHAHNAADSADHDATERHVGALSNAYLAGIGQNTRALFVSALQNVTEDDDARWHERFRHLAELLTAPDRVLAAVSNAPTRTPAP